ncbi:MAG: MurR/RpiR family transcriptional regulator [Clostridia bacterium]|nr:MurR/RpiR family transcriptional regulator [Clostridia bacterium]
MNRNLLKEIEDKMSTFSKGQKLISNFIIENYDKAAYMTAAKLGSHVNVSESTVVRFAIELGFDGYPDFQHALQEIVRTKLTSFQRMEVSNNLIGDSDVLTKVLLADSDKIKRTLDEIDRDTFNEAIDKIIASKNVYIMGVRSCSFLAGFLNYNLRMMFDNIKFVQTTSGSEMFEQLMGMNENDTVIAISFPRYSKSVINAVDYASHSGADIIAITDSAMSPIASKANQLLIAKSDMASFVDSLAAPLSIINAIIVELSRRKHDELTDRLKRLEEIWDEYDVYDKNQE